MLRLPFVLPQLPLRFMRGIQHLGRRRFCVSRTQATLPTNIPPTAAMGWMWEGALDNLSFGQRAPAQSAQRPGRGDDVTR
jgi:hypothetical protein